MLRGAFLGMGCISGDVSNCRFFLRSDRSMVPVEWDLTLVSVGGVEGADGGLGVIDICRFREV